MFRERSDRELFELGITVVLMKPSVIRTFRFRQRAAVQSSVPPKLESYLVFDFPVQNAVSHRRPPVALKQRLVFKYFQLLVHSSTPS